MMILSLFLTYQVRFGAIDAGDLAIRQNYPGDLSITDNVHAAIFYRNFTREGAFT